MRPIKCHDCHKVFTRELEYLLHDCPTPCHLCDTTKAA